MGNLNLSYLFIKVEDGNVPGFLAKYYSPDPTAEPQVTRDPKYDSNIVFLGSTGQIFTQGQLYGGNFGTLDSEVSDTGTNVSATVTQTDGKLTSINVTEDYATVTHTHTTGEAPTFAITSGDEGKLVKASDLSYTACYAEDVSQTYADTMVVGGPITVVDEKWPASWKDGSGNKIVPAGTNMQELVENLFLKTVDGTLSVVYGDWSPVMNNPTVKINNSSDNNLTDWVGATCEPTFTQNYSIKPNSAKVTVTANNTGGNAGYFDGTGNTFISGNYTQTINGSTTNAGTPSFSATWTSNGEAAASISSGETKVVYYGDNTLANTQSNGKASIGGYTAKTLWPANNLKKKMTTGSVSVSISGGSNDPKIVNKTKDVTNTSASIKITGYYPIYYGPMSYVASQLDTAEKRNNVFTKAFFDGNNGGKKQSYPGSTTVIETEGGNKVAGYYVAIPVTDTHTSNAAAQSYLAGYYAKTKIELKSTTDSSPFGASAVHSVDLAMEGTYGNVTYKVIYISNATANANAGTWYLTVS